METLLCVLCQDAAISSKEFLKSDWRGWSPTALPESWFGPRWRTQGVGHVSPLFSQNPCLKGTAQATASRGVRTNTSLSSVLHMQSLCYPARKAGLLISCLLLEECRNTRTCVCVSVCVCVHICCCCSVSHVCSLQPHGLQHPRLPCPSPSPRVCSNSCALSR